MPTAIALIATLAAALSAAALYAGSRHCRWASWRRLGRAGSWLGVLLATASLALWIAALGAGAGTCAMLGTWMLSMMAWPYIAGMRVSPATGAGDHNGGGG